MFDWREQTVVGESQFFGKFIDVKALNPLTSNQRKHLHVAH